MRLVFAGTPEFASTALRRLCDAGFEVPLVLTQPDRPAGRGLQLHESPVKLLARERGIALIQPRSLRLDGRFAADAQAAQAAITQARAQLMVVAAYGLMLPPWLLTLMQGPQSGDGLGCINIHASLLPRWRGAAPIHRAIEAGDAQSGVTIMQMGAGLDTGPMLAVQSLPIDPQDNTGTLHDKLAVLGADMLLKTLREIEQGSVHPTPQPEQGVTYASKISKEEAALDFSLPAQTLARKIRAFNPFPGAHASVEGALIKLWQAEALPQSSTALPGEVLAATPQQGVLVACGEGVLRLTELQKAGGKRLPAVEFIKGLDLSAARFS